MDDTLDPDIIALRDLVAQAVPLLAHRPVNRSEAVAKVALARTLRDLADHAQRMLDADDDTRARALLASVEP